MSYEIVKGIQFRDSSEVWIKSACNNLYPRHFGWWHCKSLTKVLREKGKVEAEKEILLQYWNGNFQGTNNLYDRSVQYFRPIMPHTWTNVGETLGEVKWGTKIEYTYDDLKSVLYDNYVNYRGRPKGNFYIRKDSWFVRKITKKHIQYATTIDRAKRFCSYKDAKIFSREISGSIVYPTEMKRAI